MKSTSLAAVVAAAHAAATFSPHAMSHSDLFATSFHSGGHSDAMVEALSRVGMMAVTGIPGWSELRPHMLREAHRCASATTAAETTTFEDGTVRTSIGGKTTPAGAEPIEINSAPECAAFEEASASFRKLVGQVSSQFSDRLSESFSTEKPILGGATHNYDTISDVVHSGIQLEHFHSYNTPMAANKTGADTNTIDLHTDQGLFIAFTPAITVSDAADPSSIAMDSAKFIVQHENGGQVEAKFDEDSLVFMLGDGVHQIINPKAKFDESYRLRATPHALDMPVGMSAVSRSWYGRMYLPPMDAVSEEHGLTYGRLRELMIEEAKKPQSERRLQAASGAASMGCSRQLYARELSQASCAANQLWCWNRCQNYTATASPSACAADGKELKCMSQYDQISDGNDHGDYWNGCAANSSSSLTPAPTFARQSCDCAPAPAPAAGTYDNLAQLGVNTSLAWSMTGGALHGELTYSGRAGWVAIGLDNGGKHNGMNDAAIVMGMVTPYLVKTNPDQTFNDQTHVAEYRIHASESAFRWWSTPIAASASAVTASSIDAPASGCYLKITFEATGLGGRAFNLTGTDSWIWAVATDTYHVGYHGSATRGKVTLDYTAGTAVEPPVVCPPWGCSAPAPAPGCSSCPTGYHFMPAHAMARPDGCMKDSDMDTTAPALISSASTTAPALFAVALALAFKSS